MNGSALTREIWGCPLGYTLSVKYLKNHCDDKRVVLVVMCIYICMHTVPCQENTVGGVDKFFKMRKLLFITFFFQKRIMGNG